MSQPRSRVLLRWFARRARTGQVGQLAPYVVRAYRGWAGAMIRFLFRPTIRGLESLPADRPYLLVSNHSGGGGVEVLALMMHWAEAHGGERRIAGMAHPVAFSTQGVGRLLRDAGAIPSTYEAATDALAQGIPVLVFPGGDFDAFRPIWQARRVDFNRRMGFLRIARRAWVPLVPMGIRGSHYTQPILWRSRMVLPWFLLLPVLAGLKRFPLTLSGALGAILLLALLGPTHGYVLAGLIAWVWLASPFALFLPILPWTIRTEVGAPIEPEELFGTRDEDAPLDEAYQRVVGEIARLVDPHDRP